MWEDIFQVYKRRCGYAELMASDMSIYDATLFVRAWMQDNFDDQETSLEIRRQPIDYHDQDNTEPPKEEDKG